MKLMRDMSTIESEFAERGVEFLAVNVYDEPEAARRFIESSGYDYTWARADEQTLEQLGIGSIPAMIVLDQSGSVAWRSGLFTLVSGGSDLREALDELTRG